MILKKIDIVECPRDAMQGLKDFVPTETKVQYINKLLEVGFHTIDFGSFVSPKAVPQMRDTGEVLNQLIPSNSRLLAIVANIRGAQDACKFEEIHDLGFPLSVNEKFQQRNTGKSIEEALRMVAEIQNLVLKYRKRLVVYLSMAFGNPYGDLHEPSLIVEFTEKLRVLGVSVVAVSDTVGVSTPESINSLMTPLIKTYPEMIIGAHLHATPYTVAEKTHAVLSSGCTRIDTAMMGFGGCPMADDDLTGNMDTETVLKSLEGMNLSAGLNLKAFAEAKVLANEVFSSL